MGLFGLFKKNGKINLERVKNNIVNSLSKEYGLKFDGKIETDSDDGSQYVKLTNSLTHSSYRGDIFCKILVFPSGSFSVEYVFDKISVNDDVLELLHDFNKNIAFLSAYVRDDEYLVVHYNVAYLDEEHFWENTRRALNSLSNETIEKYLIPLSQLTYSNAQN